MGARSNSIWAAKGGKANSKTKTPVITDIIKVGSLKNLKWQHMTRLITLIFGWHHDHATRLKFNLNINFKEKLAKLIRTRSDLRETVECGIVAIEPGADAQAVGMYGKAFELYYFLGGL